jgi:hypothetical protein
MMPKALSIALALFAAPALAQDCAATTSVLGAFVELTLDPVVSSTATTGWCRATNLKLGGDTQYSPVFTVETLDWQTTGSVEMAGETVSLPRSLDIKFDGLRIGVTTGDPVMDWLMAAQRQPMSISGNLSLYADPEAKTLDLTSLSIDFPGDNALSLTAAVTVIDASQVQSLMQSLPQARVTAIDLEITTNGLFESYALIGLGSAFLAGSTDPAADVAAIKAAVSGFVGGLPDVVLDPEERAALGALIADLPNPAATVSISVAAAGGIGADRLAAVLIGGISGVLADPARYLQGIDIGLSYVPTPPANGEFQ